MPINNFAVTQHDSISRTIVSNYFNSIGIHLVDNPDIYGIDLITPNYSIGVEVEHNLFWTSNLNRNYINIFKRKAKYFINKAYQSCIVFLDAPLKTMLILHGEHIINTINTNNHINTALLNHNNGETEMDSVYRIDIGLCKYIKL